MKRIIIFFFLLGFALPEFLIAQSSESKEILYVGTFADSGEKGIYVFEFNRNNSSLKQIQAISGKASPSFLEVHPNGKFLYAVYREGITPDTEYGSVTSFKINQRNGKLTKLNEQSAEGAGPCHISIDPHGEYAYVSNYGGGNLSVLPIQDNGKLDPASDVIQHEGKGANPNRQQSPHMHSIIPSGDGQLIYASDLGIDKIMTYKLNRNSGKLAYKPNLSVKAKPGSGPRHFDLHPNGNYAYSAEELTSTVAAYKVNKNGKLSFLQRVSMLPDGFEENNSAADIQVSPDGNFVYASNRGHNSLAIFKVNKQTGKLVKTGYAPTRGKTPRNFLIDQASEFAFVANQNSGTVVLFKRNLKEGNLTYAGSTLAVPGAVCIQQLQLP